MSIRWKASIVIVRQKRKFFLRADLELYNTKQLCNIAVLQNFSPDASLQNCELNLYAKNQKLSNSFDWQKWQKKSTIVICPMSFQRSKKTGLCSVPEIFIDTYKNNIAFSTLKLTIGHFFAYEQAKFIS